MHIYLFVIERVKSEIFLKMQSTQDSAWLVLMRLNGWKGKDILFQANSTW